MIYLKQIGDKVVCLQMFKWFFFHDKKKLKFKARDQKSKDFS